MLLASLQIRTGTPDALCPALGAVEAAVEARVGEVRTGDYFADYQVVRDTLGAPGTIELSLLDGEGQLLLSRRLPLRELACSDAATAIALVLDQYFEALASPADRSDPQPQEATSPGAEPTFARDVESAATPTSKERVAARAPVATPGPRTPSPAASRSLALSATFGLSSLQSPQLGVGAEYHPHRLWGFELHAETPLGTAQSEDEAATVRSYGCWLGAGLRARARMGRWSGSAGPVAALLVQGASLVDEARIDAAGTSLRAVPGLGGAAALRLAVSGAMELELGARGGGLLPGVSSRFVLATPDEARELLPAPNLFFSGWVGIRYLP